MKNSIDEGPSYLAEDASDFATNSADDNDPHWVDALVWTFQFLFLSSWFTFWGFCFAIDGALHNSPHHPTGAQVVALHERGQTVYVTPSEKRTITMLKDYYAFGMITWCLGMLWYSIWKHGWFP